MMGGGGSGGDAERWLATAEKLLLSGDLNGSKTYAIRACEADHSLVDHAELILAVADTLIAGESRIRGSTADLPDWYAVLRLVRLTHNPELVATQYSRLAVLLNPSRNRLPYSDQAFRLISDAWYVLSDPSRKALYDRELHLSQFGQLGQIGFQLFNQPPQSPQHQQQSPQHQQQSPQHQQQHLRASFQNQQIPFQLHQQPQQHPHFAQPQHQKSQFDQQLMQSQSLQEQQHASWRQQFGQEQNEPMRSGSSSSGRDWKLPVEEERLINLNNATERVQPSHHFNEPERSSSGRSFEASSHRSPSTDLTWPSKPTQTSEPVPWQSAESPRQFQPSRSMEAAQLSLLPSASDQPYVSQQTRSTQSHAVPKPTQTCAPVPWQSSEQPRQFQPSRFMEAAQLSLLPSVSDQTSVSQQTRSTQSHSVSKPQPVSKPFSVSQPSATAKPFPVSQPPPASKPLPVSQPPITSKPLPVSQPAKTTTPLPVSQPPITSKPFSVSQPPASKPFQVSQPPPVSKPLPVSQPPITSKTFPVSQPLPASKPFPVSQPPPASKPLPVSQSPPTSQPFPVSQSPITSKPFSVSQPSATAKPFTVSQTPPASKPFPVSQPPKNSKPLLIPQPPPTSKPLPVSQPSETSNPLPVSQPPHQAFQSTAPSHLPVASSRPAPLPPVFNSAQSLQPPPVSATPSPVPAISTNPSPPPPLSQPTWVPNQTPATEHSPESGVARSDSDPKVPSFWTTCPYCFVLYEYPSLYEESVLQCQTRSCRRAFQAVKVPSPPPIAEEDSYYCCWGFYPIGFTEMTKIPVNDKSKSAPRGFPMVAKIPGTYIPIPAPTKPSPKVYYYDDDDDDSYIDSDPSEDEDDGDDDWLMNGTKKRKNVKQSKQKASTKPKRGRTRKIIEVD